MTETTTVTVSGYAYEVKDAQGKIHTVCKDRSCSCGKENCWHVRQVRQYLNKGGAKAPDAPTLNTEHLESLFTGNNHWHSRCSQELYKNPYSLKYWAGRVAKLKAGKSQMDADGTQNTLGAVGQYWYDMIHGVDVQKKWNLNEPSFPVTSYVK